MALERIGQIEVHPAAKLFPEMGGDDLAKLTESVRERGVLVPVMFFEGKLLDGRNRLRACLGAGLDPTNPRHFPRINLPADTDPYLYAWDRNCERLDYDKGKKVEIRALVDEASGKLAQERAETRAAADRARSEKAKKQPRPEGGKFGQKPVAPHDEGETVNPKSHHSKSAERIGKETGTSPATVERRMATMRGKKPRPTAARKKSKAKNWSVPRNMKALAAFLIAKLPSNEVRELVALLKAGMA